MYRTQIKLILDLHQTAIETIFAKQYDNMTRYINIEIVDRGIKVDLNTINCVARLKAKTQPPANRNILKLCTIDTDGTITFPLDSDLLYDAGKTECEIMLLEVDTRKVISTMPFILHVKHAVFNEKDVTKEEYDSIFNELLIREEANNQKLIAKINEMAYIKQHMYEYMYPIGSIYITTDSRNPGDYLFPHTTWEPWGAGRVPIGVDVNNTDFNTVEKIGGAYSESYTPTGSNTNGAVSNTTLTAAQSGLPAHTHNFTQPTISGGTHTHTYSGTTSENGEHLHTYDVITGSDDNNHTMTGRQANAAAGADADPGATTTHISTTDGVTTQTTTAEKVQNTTSTISNHTHTYSGTTSENSTMNIIASGGVVQSSTVQNASQPHGHEFTQPTFTGKKATISHIQPYITCYMWKRIPNADDEAEPLDINLSSDNYYDNV